MVCMASRLQMAIIHAEAGMADGVFSGCASPHAKIGGVLPTWFDDRTDLDIAAAHSLQCITCMQSRVQDPRSAPKTFFREETVASKWVCDCVYMEGGGGSMHPSEAGR